MLEPKKKTGKINIESTRFTHIVGPKSVKAKKVALKKVAKKTKNMPMSQKKKEMIFAAIANK